MTRLRRWFAVAAIALTLVVAGVYIHRRSQVRDVLRHIPGKIDVKIQQTAEGFKVSKSEQGRTLFTIQASKAVQFKLGGRAELHNVTITLFGRDSSRYDQIYGDDFAYDPQSGDVTAKGEVRIDLETNPEGILKPDQAVPATMKNPIHLVTRDLIFNQKTGDAFTNARVELRMPQVAGSATGAHYAAKNNVLTLDSAIDLALPGKQSALTATRGTLSKDPRQFVLEGPRLSRGTLRVEAQKAIMVLRDDNTVERVVANEQVKAELAGKNPMHARARQAEFQVNDEQDGLSSAVFSGDVQIDSVGDRPAQASAGKIVLDFSDKNLVRTVHALENVKLVQRPGEVKANAVAKTQRVEVSAPAMDFFLPNGRRMDRAETSGAAQIVVVPVPDDGSRTVATAQKFEGLFDKMGRLTNVHGAPDARIVNTAPGQPDRTSTSQTLDVTFRPVGGIDSIVQQGNVTYGDNERQAHADRARYTPADQILEMSGSPRVIDKSLTTTARTLRLNRANGDATAEGDVKSTYSDLREQPNGALLASTSPIHVTAKSMTIHRSTSNATYSGDARIWQDANVVEAPTIQFDRDRRSVTALGDGKPVSTVLIQTDKKGAATPVSITSQRLTYTDDQHQAHFEGGVTARGSDVTITSDHLDAFMIPRSQESSSQSFKGQGRLDHIVAEGGVVVREPVRHAEGDRLVYTASEDKFVLTGGPPSIFDAERGQIRGDSLTFYKRDDRVLVEGRETSPTLTQTRVAH